LFYIDFTEYSIFGHFGGEDEPPLGRLALECASATSRRAGHDPTAQSLIHDLDGAVDLGMGQVKLM
jgi:hypothetical protein